jgi:hypothetical protein
VFDAGKSVEVIWRLQESKQWLQKSGSSAGKTCARSTSKSQYPGFSESCQKSLKSSSHQYVSKKEDYVKQYSEAV